VELFSIVKVIGKELHDIAAAALGFDGGFVVAAGD
jgi:hypothetical protein